MTNCQAKVRQHLADIRRKLAEALKMVMKSVPTTYACPSCGWKKTVAPMSDVRLPGVNGFDRCPECGNEDLDAQAAGAIDGLLAQAEQTLRRPGK